MRKVKEIKAKAKEDFLTPSRKDLLDSYECYSTLLKEIVVLTENVNFTPWERCKKIRELITHSEE